MKWTLPLYLFFLIGSAVIYPRWGDTQGALVFGNVAQIVSLMVAGYNLYLTTNIFRAGDAPRKAWARIGFGIWIWWIGQVLESYCDLILNQVSYGTVADTFWVIGYFPIISGIFLLFQNFRSTGLPIGSARSYVLQMLILLLVYGVVFYLTILSHLMDSDRRLVIRILDITYPTFDVIVIAVATVLIRISWMLRGGSLARIYVMLCLGFLLVCVSDLLLQISEDVFSSEYRMADIGYFSAYFFIALSAKFQKDALSS